jgi:Fe-S oxidoreductase
MQKFDLFVLPFTIGLFFLVSFLVIRYFTWIKNLPGEDRTKIKEGFFSFKSITAVWEVFLESLLHRKIFRVNPLLGYMHMSLAFGWLLLILMGNFESRLFYNGHISPPYVPIFFRFFNPNPATFGYEKTFSFLMDFILMVVLSGVLLAWTKRMYSRLFGMKKTTVLKLGDKLALSSLWLIFPLRFLAESLTSAAYGGGHFLTSNAGSLLGAILPAGKLVYPAWWAYSFSLGVFFVSLPFSRYMHIPTEVLLIFLRKYGVSEKKEFTTYTNVEVASCSRCGICIDRCQLASAAGIKGVQTVYYIQNVRNNDMNSDQSLNCLMCGRCDSVCPVGIDIASIRTAGRNRLEIQRTNTFDYIDHPAARKADVIYFAGCMTHLQPSVKKSMKELLKAAGINYWFMDENGSICCGRPMMLSGKLSQARELMEKNKAMIKASGAKTFVTSCPICYKVFKDDYKLDIEVLHHSEYLLRLTENKELELNHQNIKAVYHDPCELGRGSGIYDQPRTILNNIANLVTAEQERENAVCCGGSLANMKISSEERKLITQDAINTLIKNEPDILVTSCPMCKKTFAQSAPVSVMDIAEVMYKSLIPKEKRQLRRVIKRIAVPEEIEIV